MSVFIDISIEKLGHRSVFLPGKLKGLRMLDFSTF